MIAEAAEIEELARDAVLEVFDSMLAMPLKEEPPVVLPADPQGQIAGSVGFIGEGCGLIYLYAGVGFANLMTSRMLGIDISEVETPEMVNDAVGELSNMVGGYVKSRLCDGGWTCTLTIPSIVRGQQLSIDTVGEVTRKVLAFTEGTHHLLLEILFKNPPPK